MMTEILSREEWLLVSIFGDAPPPKTVAHLLATIKALAEALEKADATFELNDFGWWDNHDDNIAALRGKGWLE